VNGPVTLRRPAGVGSRHIFGHGGRYGSVCLCRHVGDSLNGSKLGLPLAQRYDRKLIQLFAETHS
jgi:hypothetical protein